MWDLTLREHERLVVPDLGHEQALALQATGALSVALAPGGHEIRAGAEVGVVSADGLRVRIMPKVPLARLLYLIGYAADIDWREEDIPAVEDLDLVQALATVFCFHVERALRQGVLQGYGHREDALLTVKGRIRTSDQLSRRFGLPVPVEVAYDEIDVDIVENRLLRMAAQLLLRLPGLPTGVRQRLRRIDGLLHGVGRLPMGDVPEVRLTRLNRRYGPALALARLVLQRRSVETSRGGAPGQAFLVNMNRLFERFLGAALRAALRPHGGRLAEQDQTKLDTAGVIDVRPDLVWRRGGRVRAVIDAKYKSLGGLRGPSGDVYQALAYCVAHDLPRCWLVYAAGNERPAEHEIRHLGATVAVAAIDLNADIDQLHLAASALASDMAAAAD